MKQVAYAIADGHHGSGRPEFVSEREISHRAEKFPLHVLVVDDEALIRWSVTESLAHKGLIVEQAEDAAAALEAITSRGLPFDVVILDLRLPDMHDLSLLGTIRQVLPRAAVFVMTAFGTPDVVAEALELGARKVLTKPFDLDELRRLVLSCERTS